MPAPPPPAARTSLWVTRSCKNESVLNKAQRSALHFNLDTFMRGARDVGASDQDVAEWMLQLGCRWLKAHGVPAPNVLEWCAAAVSEPVVLRPMTVEARARNDFGGGR